MKKIILLFITILTLTLTGCSFTKEDTFIISISNKEVNLTLDKELWNEDTFNNPNAKSEFSVTVNDVIYKGTYVTSKIERLQSYKTNIYKTVDEIEFGINDKTNKLTYLNLKSPNYNDTELYKDDIKDSSNKALELAKKVANELIDTNSYEFIIDEPFEDELVNRGQTYFITYYKFTYILKYNNMPTTDKLEIEVNSKGNLTLIKSIDLDSINKIKEVNFIKEEVDKKINNKINKTLKKNNYKINSKSIVYETIALDDNLNVGIYSIVNVEVMNKENNLLNTSIAIFTIL